jgi:hypothetical protein
MRKTSPSAAQISASYQTSFGFAWVRRLISIRRVCEQYRHTPFS